MHTVVPSKTTTVRSSADVTDQRAPIDRLVDLALAVPTCTVASARRVVPIAARAGAVMTFRFVERLSIAVQERMREDDAAQLATSDTENADTLFVSDQPIETPTIDSGELPIDGYDDLAARQVVDRLASLDISDLVRVEIYEREHRNRSTVLGKISILTS